MVITRLNGRKYMNNDNRNCRPDDGKLVAHVLAGKGERTSGDLGEGLHREAGKIGLVSQG